MSQISDNARKMRDYIIEHGWIQGRSFENGFSEPGKVCLYGAAIRVGCNEETSDSVLGAISMHTEGSASAIVTTWNDTEGRTQEEVLEMLENVAIKYDDDSYTSGASDECI